MSSNMVRRIAFAVVAIPLLVAVVWIGDWPLVVLLIVAATLGITELFQLAARTGTAPMLDVGRVVAALVPISMILVSKLPDVAWLAASSGYVALLIVVLVVGSVVSARSPVQRPLASVAVTLFGVVYTAVLPSMLFVIRHAQWGSMSRTGTALAVFPLVVTWVSDSAAMLGGQLLGGAKLSPLISPAKTRAGGVAGLLGGTAVGVGYALVVFPRVGIDLDVLSTGGLALVLSVAGQIGDLVESLFKREAGVKDSSSLIPGHGGVLDRLDSLYFAIPVAAIGFRLLGVL